ncbi:ATP-grasp domain-containing protein [Rivibacter subsaxonicus]|uniref:Putative ATP-grasp superfamily ATP-dependent carboligase n=1 Tax=Rivibacter subsaxonicus TaxID=457575 RepID=A0A4Q7W0M1_9BURK|nr:ATP-grasp domain-containing protein [Rivibacter subsaxonicus]RZU02727.1 putative ATP-grasp superfamily ATP-dependent carboligase [Rivibacter subsaxonicus]
MQLVVAGTSARLLTEAAAREGHQALALDAFGDLDTRRAARRWQPLAHPGSLDPDPALLLPALARAAREDAASAWIAGGGFDAAPAWLAEAEALLPRLGSPAASLRALRDPVAWFGALARESIAHPATCFELPPVAEREQWLVKDPLGSGGWQVRPASRVDALRPGHWVQRIAVGRPMSALFVAYADGASLVGCQRQRTIHLGHLPHVYAGVIGPMVLSAPAQAAVRHAIEALSRSFALRGLASLDFILGPDAASISVLELNARPSASMALYPRLPLIGAHLAACHGELLPDLDDAGAPLCGHAIVYADRGFKLSAAAADWLAQQSDRHDLPQAGLAFERGDPVCSLSLRAAAPDADAESLDTKLLHAGAHCLASLEALA